MYVRWFTWLQTFQSDVNVQFHFVRCTRTCTIVESESFLHLLLCWVWCNVCAFSFVFSSLGNFQLVMPEKSLLCLFPPDLNSDFLAKHKNMFTVAPLFCSIHIINTATLNLFYTLFSLPTPHPHPPPLYEKVKSWTYQCAEFCLDNHSPNDKQWNSTSSDVCENFCWNLIFGQKLKLLGNTWYLGKIENYFSNQMIHCTSAWSGEDYVSWQIMCLRLSLLECWLVIWSADQLRPL